MRASLLCVLLATPLFAAAPVPRPVSPANVQPAAYAQSTPDAASNGHGFIAVWDDQRMQERSSFFAGSAAYATRLDADGHPRDPFGVQVGPPQSYRPFVASNGRGYLAAYSTNAGGWTVTLDEDAHPAAAARAISTSEIMGLASNGSSYCALAAGYESAKALLLDEQGNVTASVVINGWAGTIVAAQGRYIILTLAGTRIVATTISATGIPLDQRTIATEETSYVAISARSNGSRVLVSWIVQTAEGRHVDEIVLYAHGAPVGGIRRVFETTVNRNHQMFPVALAWDGRSFLLGYYDLGLYAVRVETDGDIDDAPVLLDTDAETFGSVFDGARVLLVSAEKRSESADPVARVVPSFADLHAFPPANVISFSPSPQSDPDVAVAPSGIALAVSREEESYGSITASVFSPAAAGNETHIVIAEPRYVTMQDGPSVAAASDLFLVVWREAGDYRTRILAQRVTLSGALLGAPIVIAEEPRTYAVFAVTSVAFDGQNFLVAWHAQDDEIRVRSITHEGFFNGPALTVSRHDASEKRERRTPAVIWTGETFLVAWSESLLEGSVSEANPLRNVYRAARLTRDLTLLDAGESLTLYTIDGYSHGIALALGPDRVLMTSATGGYLSNSQWSVHAQMFDLAGTPTGGVARIDTTTSAKRIHPAAAWNGKSFSVFWTEQPSDEESILTGIRVLSDGSLDERIDGGPSRSFLPAAASVSGGVLVVETVIAPEQANVARLYARTFVNHPPKGRASRH